MVDAALSEGSFFSIFVLGTQTALDVILVFH